MQETVIKAAAGLSCPLALRADGRTRRSWPRQPASRAALLAVWLIASLARPALADDLFDLPLEQLLQTEVISAASFARELTDAPSAVAVVTAEDIRIFGYRTLAEILDSMRGLNIGDDRTYFYPGGRGYGKPGEYAGRITLLIDGYPAADNMYNQIFLGKDGLLDTAVIERVEYAPGPGAAIYGNNAFLGVINVITRRGRDLDGGHVALIAGSNEDQEARLTWGKRFGNGAEWLVSASNGRSDPADPIPNTEQTGSRNQRLFLKGQLDGWRMEGALARRKLREAFGYPALGFLSTAAITDENAFWSIGHDADFGIARSSLRLHYGHYRYTFNSVGRDVYVDSDYTSASESVGRWWSVDGKLSATTRSGHRLVVGAEFRDDFSQRYRYQARYSDGFDLDLALEAKGRTASVYLQDEMPLGRNLDLNLGLRYDRHLGDSTPGRVSPRAALLFRPRPDTVLKLSHGLAHRRPSWLSAEVAERAVSERIATTELVVDHQRPGLRLLATLYRYRSAPHKVGDLGALSSMETVGAEIEAQWQWRAATVRASHAWQDARDGLGDWLTNSPHHLSKLQVSVPLAGEALRTCLAARYVGKRLTSLGERTGGYAVADLTIVSRTPVPGLGLTAAVRNLLDRRYVDVTGLWVSGGVTPRDGRTFWLQAEYQFK